MSTSESSASFTRTDVTSEFVRLSWLDAFQFVKERTNWLSDVDAPTTAQEARARLCLTSSGSAAEPPVSGTCDGPVLRISLDHLHFSDQTFVLLPIDEGVVVYDAGMVGGGMCAGSQSSSLHALEVEFDSPFLVLKLSDESFEYVEESGECVSIAQSHREIRYDAEQRRATRITPALK